MCTRNRRGSQGIPWLGISRVPLPILVKVGTKGLTLIRPVGSFENVAAIARNRVGHRVLEDFRGHRKRDCVECR